MDNNLQQHSSGDQEDKVSNDINKRDKKMPEDIFAESSNPNSRLTPVDAKKQGSASEHPTIKLPDPPTAAPQVTPKSQPPVARRQKGGKVMVLMIAAIAVILIFAISFVAFQFLKPSGADTVTNEEAEPFSPEPATVVTPPVDFIVEDEIINEPIDTDKDGLTDERELELGLNTDSADTDEDGLSDKDEVDIYMTDPFNMDTDGDGFLDGSEVKQGYDPNGPGRLNDINKQSL